MFNSENLRNAIAAKALTANSIQSIAYELALRDGVRSDALASSYGSELNAGNLSKPSADFLVTVEHIGSVYDEVEAFVRREEEADIKRISEFLYENDQVLGFCGHDIDGKSMKAIIQTIKMLLENPQIDAAILRGLAGNGISASKAGTDLRRLLTRDTQEKEHPM